MRGDVKNGSEQTTKLESIDGGVCVEGRETTAWQEESQSEEHTFLRRDVWHYQMR